MEHVVISLSAAERAFLDEQVVQGGYDSLNDYVSALVTAELKAKARERLEALLLEGLQDEPTEWTSADTAALMRLAATGK